MDDSIYEALDVPEVINGVGTKTRVGGTRIREEAVEAMRAAARSFARISDLQARASQRISDATGSEAGYVVSGAASGLTLATAACLAGRDFGVMDRLPDTEGVPDRVVVPHAHRNSYDHAIRAAGARLVTVGNSDRTLGPGSSDLEPWELERAIGSDTAAVAYVPRDSIPLEPITEIAHRHDVPVIVDAAGRLPPKRNLERFVREGADAVVFSGGKAIRGPQSTGFIAGRRDLIASVALQHLDMDAVRETWNPPETLVDVDPSDGVPRHGIGRGHKVGKEELVGFLVAFEAFLDEDTAALYEEWEARARSIERRLDAVTGLTATGAEDGRGIPTVAVHVDETETGIGAVDLVNRLRGERPRVFVGDRDAGTGTFTVHPMSLTDEDAEYLVGRVRAHC